MQQAQKELINWQGLGTSVMEISHRSKEFIKVAEEAEQDLRDLLNIPDNYKVLFCQGGARAQFAAVPLNLLGDAETATYIDGGYWAESAVAEAKKYCEPDVFNAKTVIDGKAAVLPATEWKISPDAAYVHFCPNETIDGVEINDLPVTDKPIVADMSSTILSREIDISKYGVIYAGAQKNIGLLASRLPSYMMICLAWRSKYYQAFWITKCWQKKSRCSIRHQRLLGTCLVWYLNG